MTSWNLGGYTENIHPRSKRLKTLLVSPEIILGLCLEDFMAKVGAGQIVLESTPIPDGATIAWCYYDERRAAFAIVLEHPSFPLIANGCTMQFVHPLPTFSERSLTNA